MSIKAWDEANEARAEGVHQMCRGSLFVVAAAAGFAGFGFEQAYKDTARAAEAFSEGGKLLSTPVPELTWWQRVAVWVRAQWRRVWL